jgi:hypothetical protein
MSANHDGIAPAGQDVLYAYGNVPVKPIGRKKKTLVRRVGKLCVG